MMGILNRFGAKRRAAVLALTVVADGLTLWGQHRLAAFGAGFILMCLLPGYLLTRWLLVECRSVDWMEAAALTVGMGFVSLILGTLLLHYIPGPLTPVQLLVLYNAIIVFLALVPRSWSRAESISVDRSRSRQLLLVLALVLAGAYLRFANLGYSEFQGDEARAMLMAAGALRGEDGILFQHKKGPAEILVPMASYGLQGTTNELVARIPFGLASVAGLLGMYVLARLLFPTRGLVSMVTLGLLAVDGYLVAFGRIVQYQSIVFLLVALTAWCSYAWFCTQRSAFAVAGALLLAVGTLAHYEAILIAPFVIWPFFAKAREEGWSLAQLSEKAAGPGLAFFGIAGAFYVPFLLDAHFAGTLGYITEQRLGGARLYNNLADFFWRASFYNSTYYVVFLSLALLALLTHRLCVSLRPPVLRIVLPLLFLGSFLVVAFSPNLLVVGGINWAFLPLMLPLGILLISPHPTIQFKITLLWFVLPCFLALFFVRKPKTHVYTMLPAWAVLVGVATSQAVAALHGRARSSSGAMGVHKAVLSVAGVALLGLFGCYTYMAFVRHTPSFLHDYAVARPAIYPYFYDEPPKKGLFGFPHRNGWKAIGALFDRGELQGSYTSNEETLVTSWYARQAAWCPGDSDYTLIASFVQDEQPISVWRVDEESHLLGRVWSDDRVTLDIYSRSPSGAAEDYDLSALERAFDVGARRNVWLWALSSPLPEHRVDARLGQHISLVGFDAQRRASIGGTLPLQLYWRTAESIDRRYSVFCHIEVEGQRIWAQSDGTPGCGSSPTTAWQPLQTIVDGHSLSVDSQTPPGEYPLLVGLYDPVTGERLPVVGRDVNSWGNAAFLGTVRVVAPNQAGSPKVDEW